MFALNPETTAQAVFTHLPPAEGLAWAMKFVHHSAPSFADELTYAGYKDVPCSWLLCEDDLTIKPEYQQKAIERIEAASGMRVDVTRAKLDHAPLMDRPEEVTDWLRGLLEKGGGGV